MLRLNNAFGIGIIKLNVENIEQSEIIIPSRINDSIDWETVDRLVEVNPDFKNFVISINDVAKSNSKTIHKDVFDKIFSDSEISRHIKDKKIK